MNAYQNKNIFQVAHQLLSKTSETTNRMIFTETKIRVHFCKKIQDIIIIFHDFPGFENGLIKFHDFPGRVVTLLITGISPCCGCL